MFITTYYEEHHAVKLIVCTGMGGWGGGGLIKKILHTDRAALNPLPHGGRTYLPNSSLHANSYKSSEGMVSSKIRYSSS